MSTEVKSLKINTKDIIINPLAQRDVEKRKAQFNKIMRTFNSDLVNPIKVALINGKYYCFDGQMTMKVLKARNKGKDLCVECKCYYGLTDLEMAELFVNQCGVVSKVLLADKIRVLKNYGDERCTKFVNLSEKNGILIAWKNEKGRHYCRAVSALLKCFDELEGLKRPELYEQFCRVINEAWDGDPESLRTEILRGVSRFIKAYEGEFNEERLIRKLQSKRPIEIIRDAQVDRSSGDRKFGVQVLQIYNWHMGNPLPNKL